MNTIDSYEEYSDSFRGRQHLVNHVDMILGQGDANWSKGRNGRDLLLISPDGESISLVKLSTLSNERIAKARSWILRESLFATEWQQIALLSGDEYILSNDIRCEDDVSIFLDTCINIWANNSEDLQDFAQKTSIVVLLRCWDTAIAGRIVVRRRPEQGELEKLPVAINSHRVMSTRYSDDTAWKAFAERICKNVYVKQFLRDNQKDICPVCESKLGKRIVVHHIDYNHRCAFCCSGLDWKIAGTRVQPDCRRCQSLHSEWFNDCMSRLRAVHVGCNYLIDCML